MNAPAKPGWTMRTRLMLAQGIVLTAGVLTAALVAAVAGPPLFHQHLLEAGHTADSPELAHIEQAYASANIAALSTALVIALLAAFVVTWYVTRRITQPLTALAAVATRLSEGDYAARAAKFSSGPELDRLGSTFNDVAERLQTTEDTRRRLLADLSHEMRTPLATTAAYLDGLEDGLASWGPDVARVLRDQHNRLLRLATDIAEVSQAEEGRLNLDLQAIPVTRIIWAAAQAVRADYSTKGIHLSTPDRAAHDANRSSTASVLVDEQRILQVLSNLLTNALRHTPPGGSVRVSAQPAGQMVRIDVTDTGDGIPPDQLPHIFERFYRGDTARARERGGSGIGLSIARSIATAHGGSLIAYSDGPSRGATFTLTIPISPPDPR